MLHHLFDDGVLHIETPGSQTPIACRSTLTLQGEAILRVHVQATDAEREAHLARLTAVSGQLLARWRRFDLFVQALAATGSLALIVHQGWNFGWQRAFALSIVVALARCFVAPPLKRFVGRWLVRCLIRQLEA